MRANQGVVVCQEPSTEMNGSKFESKSISLVVNELTFTIDSVQYLKVALRKMTSFSTVAMLLVIISEPNIRKRRENLAHSNFLLSLFTPWTKVCLLFSVTKFGPKQQIQRGLSFHILYGKFSVYARKKKDEGLLYHFKERLVVLYGQC